MKSIKWLSLQNKSIFLKFNCYGFYNIKNKLHLNKNKNKRFFSHYQHPIGQPVSNTHPHLVKHIELTPGFKSCEYKERREKLFNQMKDYSALIVHSANNKWMAQDIPYIFRQNTDFYYLTGLNEPDSILLLVKENNNLYKYILFVRKRDASTEQWDGPKAGEDEAIQIFQADEAYTNNMMGTILEKTNNEFLQNGKKLSHLYISSPIYNDKFSDHFIRSTRKYHNIMISADNLIQQQRLIKTINEIKQLKKACEIASNGFIKLMKISKKMVNEKVATESKLASIFEYTCKMNGATRLSFPSVVASGKNASIIHYIQNTQILKKNELVLVDAGCEYNGYVSDITRTWPVSGTFTKEQREIYELVLDCQLKCLQLVKECHKKEISLEDIHNLSVDILTEEMLKLKIIENADRISVKEAVDLKMYFKYYPTHVGHYLGMDVHDTSIISRNIPLKPGMVITIEPGIYINDNCHLKKYAGIGIRIEDDVVITENGIHILTETVPKTVQEIETIMNT